MNILGKGFILLLFVSCNKPTFTINTNTDLDCATDFIHCLYQGKFDICEQVILPNQANVECLNTAKFKYTQVITKALKAKYKVASIIFENKETVNDSISIFPYKNTVTNLNEPPLKLIKRNNKWYVDYAYTCSGNL